MPISKGHIKPRFRGALRADMQKFMTGALALALLASTGVASAQENGYNPQVRRSVRNTPDRPAPPPQAPQAPQAQQAPQAPVAVGERNGPRGGGQRGDDRGGPGRGDQDRGDRGDRGQGGRGPDNRGPDNRGPDNRGQDGRGQDGRDRGDRGHDGRGPDRGGPDRPRDNPRGPDRGPDRGDWNNGRNGRNWDDSRRQQPRPRYDRRRYEPIWRSQQRYRGWVYQQPRGFYSRSWVYGDIVPRGWWDTQYRILDWWSYDLPIPPVGFESVRVGDDALLIDMYSGRVVQVAYDLFW